MAINSGVMPATPDWMQSLLPAGGKVSVTVHSGPSTNLAGNIDPNTGVMQSAGQTPVTAAMRNVSGYAAPTTTVVNDPNGPGNNPPPGTPPKTVPPTPPAPPPPAPPPDPNAVHASATGYTWWNPYLGRTEAIPGIDKNGNVVNANQFWQYYQKYPGAALDAFASKLNTGNAPGTWQHQFSDQEIQNMINANPDYITGLGDINNRRFQAALAFGDPAMASGMGFTQAQLDAIQNNPASTLNMLRRALTSDIYGRNASAAAHGAYSSGARMNDIANLETKNVLDILSNKQQLQGAIEGMNTEQSTLFRGVKDEIAKEGGFDPGDTETNQKAFKDTHAIIQSAAKAGTDLISHIGPVGKFTSVNDMRGAVKDIDAYLKQYGKLISPAQAAQIKKLRADLGKRMHDTVIARRDAYDRQHAKKPKRHNPVLGGGMTGGQAGGGMSY